MPINKLQLILIVLAGGCSFVEQPRHGNDANGPQFANELDETSVRIDLSNWPAPHPAKIGFDAIAPIFRDSKHGSCARCHVTQWPYIGGDFAKLASSVPYKKRRIQTLTGLATFIADCSDMVESTRCAGDPDDPKDNYDYKMPTKFGFSPLSEQDLQLIRRWAEDGAEEFGCSQVVELTPTSWFNIRLIDEAGTEIGLTKESSYDHERKILTLFAMLDHTSPIAALLASQGEGHAAVRIPLAPTPTSLNYAVNVAHLCGS